MLSNVIALYPFIADDCLIYVENIQEHTFQHSCVHDTYFASKCLLKLFEL